MRVAIHQPHYWPWLGYLHKMKEADVFVYLDKASYEKNGFQNRNRFMIDGKEHWLTIPVLTKGKLGQSIKDVEVNWDNSWNKKQYHTLLYNYPKGVFMNYKEIEDFYVNKYKLLIDWSVSSVEFLRRAFNIKTPILFESELGVNGKSTERLVNICREVGAGTYLSGPTGRAYLKEELFGDIKIEYTNWKPNSHLSALHFYLKKETEAFRKDN